MSKPNVKIIVCDDHPLMREAINTCLEKQADFEIIAEACDGGLPSLLFFSVQEKPALSS